MQNSKSLIAKACNGQKPDRTPIFDLLANDKIIEHFSGGKLDGSKDEKNVQKAIGKALDGTRCIFVPEKEGKRWTDEVGHVHVASRWTNWVEKYAFTTESEWKEWIEKHIEKLEAATYPSEAERTQEFARQNEINKKLNGVVYIHCTVGSAINDAVFGYNCGLDHFTYLALGNPDLITHWLNVIQDHRRKQRIALMAHRDSCNLVMIYSDIAYKDRLMFGPDMLAQFGFFENIEQICADCHERGMKVILHSDGYVMDIMDELIVAGIDGFNPIEKAAGMDIYRLRKKYPELILVGGVDATNLLVNGTPEDISKETGKIIDEVGSEGNLLIGSTTEIGNDIPLENYLAFHDRVMNG